MTLKSTFPGMNTVYRTCYLTQIYLGDTQVSHVLSRNCTCASVRCLLVKTATP